MENRLNRLIKVVIALFTVLLLGVIGGFVTAVGAQEVEDTKVMKTYNNRHYVFTPTGYVVDNGEETAFTGTYILTGVANMDVAFKSDNGKSTTYNVILHNWDGKASSWYAMLCVEYGVTLNLTVYGDSTMVGYNHPGINAANYYENSSEPVVNITIMENSSLRVGRVYKDTMCVSDNVTITLNEGATSSIDMSSEGWRNEQSITFSNGETGAHTAEYTYVDESICRKSCAGCDILPVTDEKHKNEKMQLSSSDENCEAKHSIECTQCGNVSLEDHSFVSEYLNEESHLITCSECDYIASAVPHSLGENGCTECNSSYAFSVTVNEETQKYFTLEGALDAVNSIGGEIKLLADFISSSREVIEINNVLAVIDLNGFALENTRLSANGGNAKVTVIDSSENKTGVYKNNSFYASDIVGGTVELNGITVGYENFVISYGKFVINDVKITGAFNIVLKSAAARVEMTDVISTVVMEIELHFNDKYDNNIVINSGSFSKITVLEHNYYECDDNVTVKDFLPDGYAFSGEKGIINANSKSISDVSAVIEHKTHSFDGFEDLGDAHVRVCACGERESGKELHKPDESLICIGCGEELAVELVCGAETKYYISIESAVEYANGLDGAVTVKLLRDKDFTTLDTYGEIIFDLNGYSLEHTENRIYVYGKFTLIDSSEAKTGKFSSGGDDLAYIFQIEDGATLVIEGGELRGLIFTYYTWEREAVNTIIINGGRFVGTEKFRLGSKTRLEIYGGWFENRDGVIELWGGEAEIVISGGIFANSTVFTGETDMEITAVSDILSADGDCTLAMVDERGNEIDISQLLTYFKGKIIVAHKGVAVVSKENTHALVCPTCEEEIYAGEHHSFVYSANESDKALHDASCGICGADCGKKEHTGGSANCTYLAECELCGAEYGELNRDVHSGGSASCNQLAKCERCATPYGEFNPRRHTSTETKLAGKGEIHGMARICCGEIIVGYEHIYDSVCDRECNECKAIRIVNHTYATDGKCIACGVGGGEIVEPEGDGPGAVAIVITVLGTVIVFGGGAFALIRYMKKKKYVM